MKKKKTLLAVIIVLIILLIAGGAFAYVYFGTDLLKSEKELFQKYMAQLGDVENGFIPANLTAYNNKKNTTAYENTGSFKANTEVLSNTSTDLTTQMMIAMLNYGNNTNISFSGKVDNPNSRVEKNITINYSDTVNMPFKYKRDGDKYAVQSDIIAPNYIGVENNNLQEFAQKFGMDNVTEIPNKIEVQEIQSLKFSDEEKQHLMNNYITPMFNSLSEDKFTKSESEDGTKTYTLSTSDIDIKNIIIQMLQTLSNDTAMIDKINSIILEVTGDSSMNITVEDIQEAINSANAKNVTNSEIKINVIQKDGITNKILVDYGNINYSLTKNATDSDVVYNFNYTQNDLAVIDLEFSYIGVNSNNVAEKIAININVPNQINMAYTLENNVIFGNEVNIEPLGTDAVILNNYSAEEVQNFLIQATGLIVQANNSQMGQIGFPTEIGNPMLMWFMGPSLLSQMNLYSSVEQSQNLIDEAEKQEEQKVENAESQMNSMISGVNN